MTVDKANTHIRPCRDTDLPAITQLEQAQGFAQWSRQQLEDSFEHHVFFVLLLDDALIGYSIFYPLVDEVELLNIVIDSDYQKQGLAESLLAEGLLYFQKQDYKACILEVGDANQAAIALYKKLGFKPVGVRKNYYRKHRPIQHALLFRLTL